MAAPVKNRDRMCRAAGVLAAAFMVGGGLVGPAAAQSSAQIQVPLDTRLLLDPGEEASHVAQRLATERNHAAEASRAEIELVSPLRPIEARGRPAGTALRFDGERRELEFAFFVPDLAPVRALRISTLSSINVLAERSSYRVYVNEAFVGTGRLEHVTDFGTHDFDLPAGVVLRGQNRVRVELSQYHRIYCGPEASFALWSDIDLRTSGAVLEGSSVEPGPEAFLMGMALSAALGGTVDVRGTTTMGPDREPWIDAIVRWLTAAVGGDPVRFRFTDYWTVQGPAVGARVTFLPGTTERVSFRTGGDGAQVMVIEYVPGQGVGPLPAFEGLLPPMSQGAPVPVIDPTRGVALSEIGFTDTLVRDRYARIDARFRLPDDYVVLTNAKAEIRLDYAFAPDLPEGAMLLVHVNGTNIRLLPLDQAGGEPIEGFPLRFPAQLMRAGVNTLSFETLIPGDPADLPCATRDDPVLMIGAGSTIVPPYSPSMYLPDMHFAFSALDTDSLRLTEHSARAYLPEDVASLRAALGVGVPQGSLRGARLNLVAFDDLGAVPTGRYAVDRRLLEGVLLQQSEGQTGAAPQDVWSGLERRESRAAVSGGWDWVVGTFRQALHWLHPQSGGDLDGWLAGQRGQAMLLQLDPEHADQIWLIRSTNSDIEALAAAFVAARDRGEGPRGQVSVLDHEGQWNNWIAPDRQPVLLERLSPYNFRHAIGNYVSAMPVRYVVLLTLLSLLSAFIGLRLVLSTRENRT